MKNKKKRKESNLKQSQLFWPIPVSDKRKKNQQKFVSDFMEQQ